MTTLSITDTLEMGQEMLADYMIDLEKRFASGGILDTFGIPLRRSLVVSLNQPAFLMLRVRPGSLYR